MNKIIFRLAGLWIVVALFGLSACGDSDSKESASADLNGDYQGWMIYYNNVEAKNDTVSSNWSLSQNILRIASFRPSWIAGELSDVEIQDQLGQLAYVTLQGTLSLYHSNPNLYHIAVDDISLPVSSQGKSTTLTIRFDNTSSENFLAYDLTTNIFMIQVKVKSASLGANGENLLKESPVFYFSNSADKEQMIHVHG